MLENSTDILLGEIHQLIRDGSAYRYPVHRARMHLLQSEVRRRFAEANGWQATEAQYAPGQIARASKGRRAGEDGSATWCGLIDHPDCFRIGHRPEAIASHAYATDRGVLDREWLEARAGEWASQHGLRAQLPPCPLAASWYFPGGTSLVVFTREDAPPVKWLADVANWDLFS